MYSFVKKMFLVAILGLVNSPAFPQVAVGIDISTSIAPPAIPVYSQPPCPEEGFLWTPGYWAYGDEGYYWTPGVWVASPQIGYLWTPPYWGFFGGRYRFHGGYWGSHIGFYGGINYGFGYGGYGYEGGEWRGNRYHYNTAITNVNTTIIHNTYVNNKVVHNNTKNNRISFNGAGGVNMAPNLQEKEVEKEQHIELTKEQTNHVIMASHDQNQLARNNGGKPTVVSMSKVNGEKFSQEGKVPPVEKPVGEVNTPKKVDNLRSKSPDRGVNPDGKPRKFPRTKRTLNGTKPARIIRPAGTRKPAGVVNPTKINPIRNPGGGAHPKMIA
jgi:WXXGXW repeat (2 copies)